MITPALTLCMSCGVVPTEPRHGTPTDTMRTLVARELIGACGTIAVVIANNQHGSTMSREILLQHSKPAQPVLMSDYNGVGDAKLMWRPIAGCTHELQYWPTKDREKNKRSHHYSAELCKHASPIACCRECSKLFFLQETSFCFRPTAISYRGE